MSTDWCSFFILSLLLVRPGAADLEGGGVDSRCHSSVSFPYLHPRSQDTLPDGFNSAITVATGPAQNLTYLGAILGGIFGGLFFISAVSLVLYRRRRNHLGEAEQKYISSFEFSSSPSSKRADWKYRKPLPQIPGPIPSPTVSRGRALPSIEPLHRSVFTVEGSWTAESYLTSSSSSTGTVPYILSASQPLLQADVVAIVESKGRTTVKPEPLILSSWDEPLPQSLASMEVNQGRNGARSRGASSIDDPSSQVQSQISSSPARPLYIQRHQNELPRPTGLSRSANVRSRISEARYAGPVPADKILLWTQGTVDRPAQLEAKRRKNLRSPPSRVRFSPHSNTHPSGTLEDTQRRNDIGTFKKGVGVVQNTWSHTTPPPVYSVQSIRLEGYI